MTADDRWMQAHGLLDEMRSVGLPLIATDDR
jgi:hypothetical protein